MKKFLLALLLCLLPMTASAQNSNWYVPPWLQSSNTSGTTLTGPLLLPDGSAAAPALAFANDPNTGMYGASNDTLYFSTGGLPRAYLTGGIFAIGNDSASINLGASYDLRLTRDAANTLALRNGTNAQTFNVYNTYTDGANFERTSLGWNSNIFEINVNKAGTGTQRALAIIASQLTLPVAVVPPTNDNGTLGGAAGTWSWQSAYLTRSIQGNKVKTLTETVGTAFLQVAVPSGGHTSGTIYGEVYCADATDFVTYYNEWRFTCHNKAGTEACSNPTAAATAVSSASSGGSISAFTMTADTSPTNAVNFAVNTTCSLTQTTLEFHYRVHLLDPQTVTPQ